MRSGAKHIHFAAPELFGRLEEVNDHSVDDSTRTQMSDIYAFGCLYYEVCCTQYADFLAKLRRSIMTACLFSVDRAYKSWPLSLMAYVRLDGMNHH